MLKACTLFRFKSGQDIDEARKYWRGSHGDIVSAARFFKRYVQSHPILGYPTNENLPYDGFAEIWVESTQSLRDAASGPGYKAITEDEERFIDRRFTDLVLTEEHPVVDGSPSPQSIKLVHLIKRSKGLDAAAYQNDWLTSFAGEIAASRKPLKLVVSLAKLSGYRDGREPKWDVIATEWFGSLEDIPNGSPELTSNVKSDARVTMVTRAHLISEF